MKRMLIDAAFPNFDEKLRQDLERVGILREYRSGECILKMGQLLPNTCVLLQGCAKMFRENKEGAEFIVAFLKRGQGLAVSISDDSTPANKKSLISFTAIETTHILHIPFADKDLLAKKHDGWYKYILQTAVMYYAYYLELIDSVAFEKLDYRIEFFLLRLSTLQDKKKLLISHQEIATGLNASREAVSRILKKMEREGKIKLLHNEILLQKI
jgi:CRP/FNR family transcriptional regulator, anaerobic regulatory protein